MPERQQLSGTAMRAATTGERATDTIRDMYEALSELPLGQLLDALGMTDLGGMAESFADPAARYETKTGMAPRRVPPPRFTPASDTRHAELLKKFGGRQGQREQPREGPTMGGPGPRIKPNSQAGVGTPEENMAKIPRFRSEHGTFIKHEGQWWRVKEQPAGSTDVALELLPPGVPEPGTVPKVLQTKVISADDLISGIREAKGVSEPTRRVKPRFDE